MVDETIPDVGRRTIVQGRVNSTEKGYKKVGHPGPGRTVGGLVWWGSGVPDVLPLWKDSDEVSTDSVD